MGGHGVHGGSVNITAVGEIYKVSSRVDFVSEGQISQPQIARVYIFMWKNNRIIFPSNLSP
jgi:hypothetical protein